MNGIAANFGINIPGKNNGLLAAVIYPDIINSRRLLRRLLNRNFDTDKYGKNLPLMNILNGNPDINNNGIYNTM